MDRLLSQNESATVHENTLEVAIGHQVREFRAKLGMTVADVARQAGLSAGMLSKIENGMTSPSLSTLQALSRALNVPLTAFFRKFEELREATFVRAGEGLTIERRGTRAGHHYQLLGHTIAKSMMVEPYLVTMDSEPEVNPLFQHVGMEFIYLLQGEVAYRHGDQVYRMKPGDSLFFDADVPHGPEDMPVKPVRLLSLIVYNRDEE